MSASGLGEARFQNEAEGSRRNVSPPGVNAGHILIGPLLARQTQSALTCAKNERKFCEG